ALLPGVAGDLGEVDVDLVLGLVEGVDGGLVPLVLDVLEAQLPELDRGGALGGVVAAGVGRLPGCAGPAGRGERERARSGCQPCCSEPVDAHLPSSSMTVGVLGGCGAWVVIGCGCRFSCLSQGRSPALRGTRRRCRGPRSTA